MPPSISTKSAREKLTPRREPYWARIRAGLYVGYRKLERGEGTWIARRRGDDGKQKTHSLGTLADYDSAVKAAAHWASALDAGVLATSMTVAKACEHYATHLGLHKTLASKKDAEGRFKRLVYSAKIGKIDLAKLRTSDVKAWLSAQVEQDESDAEDEDDLRRAKDSANRNLASLKAALNLALRDRLVATDAGWKTVAKFKDVGRRRQGFLAPEHRKALFDACPPDLAALVKAMLLTGARPGELASATLQNFHRDQRTLALEGKTGHRVVTLSSTAFEFFEDCAKGKIGNAPLLTTEFGQRWNKDSWKKPFKAAVEAAKLPPDVVMYSLRHTAISEMIAGGIDSFIVAQLAGTSTEMIDKHYGHLRHDRTRELLDALALF